MDKNNREFFGQLLIPFMIASTLIIATIGILISVFSPNYNIMAVGVYMFVLAIPLSFVAYMSAVLVISLMKIYPK